MACQVGPPAAARTSKGVGRPARGRASGSSHFLKGRVGNAGGVRRRQQPTSSARRLMYALPQPPPPTRTRGRDGARLALPPSAQRLPLRAASSQKETAPPPTSNGRLCMARPRPDNRAGEGELVGREGQPPGCAGSGGAADAPATHVEAAYGHPRRRPRGSARRRARGRWAGGQRGKNGVGAGGGGADGLHRRGVGGASPAAAIADGAAPPPLPAATEEERGGMAGYPQPPAPVPTRLRVGGDAAAPPLTGGGWQRAVA